MIEGLPVTLSLTAYGMGLGFLLGLPLAILRVYCGRAGRLLVASYERIMRSVPALVLIFVFYFGVHTSVIEIPGFLAVALALGLCSSGY